MRVSDVPSLLLEPAQTHQGSTPKNQLRQMISSKQALIKLFKGEPTRNQVSNNMYTWSVVLKALVLLSGRVEVRGPQHCSAQCSIMLLYSQPFSAQSTEFVAALIPH